MAPARLLSSTAGCLVACLAACLAAFLAAAFAAAPADAAMTIHIDKSSQHMTVTVDGVALYRWKVSTGLGGGPPSGVFRPQRLERHWYSRKYDNAPMPHAIFFHKGYAIHGTPHVSRLGRRASHGCVRLHPANAAVLFQLVRSRGVNGTQVVVGR